MSNLQEYKTDIKAKRILSVQFNLLNACASKCKYCRKYTWPNDVLKIDAVKRTIDYLAEQGLQSVTLSGGEPLMYEWLDDAILYLHNKGIAINIITSLITNNMKYLKLISKYVNKISVSMDGGDIYSYIKARGVNAFDLVCQNIQWVNAKRNEYKLPSVRFSSTISALNVDQIVNIFNVGKSLGCKVKYYFMHDYEEFQLKEEYLAKAKSNFEEVAELDKTCISNVNTILCNFGKDTTPVCKICKIPYIHAIIDANGDIYPCCRLLDDNGKYGEQSKYSYGTIYNENLKKEFDKRFDTEYNIDTYCNGCWDRYIGKIDEVNYIFNVLRKPLFI